MEKHVMEERRHPDDSGERTIRIVDIARMAGVSTATVDRVIHHRGKVSEQNLARINAVLRQVDYRPNLIARSLASGRRRTLCVVTPAFEEGDYWADVETGIARAEAQARRYGIDLRRCRFDQYDCPSFERAAEVLHDETFDGVVIAPFFREPMLALARGLDAREIPYVFVDSDLPECNRLAYFGTPSFDAGRVAARLLCDRIDPSADIVIGRIVHRPGEGSVQCRLREEGFRAYLDATGYRGTLLSASLRLDDPTGNERELDALFAAHPSVAGAVTFNSTCHLLAGYLSAHGRRDVRLVGYDAIRRNGRMLAEGAVTALVAQRPEVQGYRSVMALCDWLVEGRPTARINPIPLDILFKENYPYYNNTI